MTPSQFRSTAAWQRARAAKLKGATHCAICSQPLMPGAKARSRWSSSVDHVMPLHDIDLNTAEGRALAVNPAWLVAVHLGCNSKRGNKTAAAKRRRPEVWNLNQVARRMAAEGRSKRW